MKQTYLITAINPDNGEIVSIRVKAATIIQAAEQTHKIRDEYRISGYLKTIISITLMNSNTKNT